jgi:endo-1,4-beta-D-glucanase Y
VDASTVKEVKTWQQVKKTHVSQERGSVDTTNPKQHQTTQPSHTSLSPNLVDKSKPFDSVNKESKVPRMEALATIDSKHVTPKTLLKDL